MTVEYYSDYKKALNTIPFEGKFLEFGWGQLPSQLDFSLMAYAEMFNEYSSGISNATNQLTDYGHRLKAWSMVMQPLPPDRQLDLIIEFVEPLAIIALTLPKAIKDRYAFAIAHLAHQANKVKVGQNWSDDLPEDHTLCLKTAENFSRGWAGSPALLASLAQIAAKDFVQETDNFRNRFNHQFPPGISIGLTKTVARRINKTSDNVTYSFGGTNPLDVEKISLLVSSQCQKCYSTFDLFKELVREFEAAMRNRYTA